MRSSILLVGVVLAATPAGAQVTPRFARAFEPSLTPWIGLRHFGDQAYFSVASGGQSFSTDAGYSPSMALGVMYDAPLTRRVGFIGDVHVAPLGRQESRTDSTAVQGERVFSGGVTAALGFRFRPQAPVFFFGGATAEVSSRKAILQSTGSAIAPGATAGVGLDLARLSHVGARIVYQAYWLKPGDPNSGSWRAQSHTFDWTLGLGARINLHGERR